MYLVVGTEDDALAREVRRQAGAASIQNRLCSEADLIDRCHEGIGVDGLRGVLIRPQPRCSSADSAPERLAALYSFLANAPCPVVNRVGLSWWVQDSSYPLQLRMQLTRALGLALESPGAKASCFGPLWPSARVVRAKLRHVFVSGGLVRKASPAAEDIEKFLTKNIERLRKWQRNTGVYLCRLDFDDDPAMHLRYVEPFPCVDNEPESLVRELALAALEITQ